MPVDAVEVEHPAEQHTELVPRARALRGEAPVVVEAVAVVEPEDGLGVADVDGEQHREIVARRGVPRSSRSRAYSASSSSGSDSPIRSASDCAVSFGSSPSPRSSSTVMSPDV